MKKITKFALIAGLLATGFVGSAPAQTVVRITGSSAYRAAVTNAVLRLLDPNRIQAVYIGSSTTAIGSSNQQIIHGYLQNAVSGTGETTYAAGTEVYFKTSWTGSISGLIALSTNSNTAQPFLSTSNISLTNTAQKVPAPTAGVTPTGGQSVASNAATFDNPQVADVAMSDVFASSTSYNSSNLSNAKTGLSGAAAGNAPAGVVGVVPFVFVAGVDAGTSITNINSVQAQQLLLGGMVKSQFTGVSGDSSIAVNAVGRDADSGTRFTTFAESGFTVIGFASPDPSQFAVTVTGASGTSGGTATAIDPYPAETLFGTSYDIGTQGYSSGSGVAGALAASGTLSAADNPGLIIGYVGESDAKNAAKFGALPLSYNGVSYATVSGSAPTATLTFNRNALDQGLYTLWGYEHEYYLKNSPIASIADAFAKNVGASDAIITGELLVNMQVSRSQEGAPISHN